MTPEDMASSLDLNNEYQVLRRLPYLTSYSDRTNGPSLRKGVILDLETTGFDYHEDKIIEVGAISFLFDKAGVIYDVDGTFCAYEDPGMPIPEEVQDLTGITNEMVKGHKIEDDAFRQFMADSVITIAHNAGFDRKFTDTRFPFLRNMPWGCSFRDVDWAAKGISSAKLDYLLYKFGYFHDGHRAEDDCRATLHILAHDDPENAGHKILGELLGNARKLKYRVWANDAPFENKDMLSKRKYQWNASPGQGEYRAWNKEVDADDLQAELDWLARDVYMHPHVKVPVHEVNARARYAPPETISLSATLMEGHAVQPKTDAENEQGGKGAFKLFPG